MSRFAAGCLFGLGALLVLPTAWAAQAELALVVVERGEPVGDVLLEVDGEARARTGADGGLAIDVAAGRRSVRLLRGEEALRRIDLLIDDAESVQILVDIRGDRVRVDIEGAATGGTDGDAEADEATAAAGALSGRVLSADDGAPVAGARVYFAGLDAEVRTDDDGYYEAEIPAGRHALSVVHPDYSTRTLEDIRVIAGQMVATDIELSPAGVELAEYVVSEPYIDGSVASVYSSQRESAGVLDVLGAEQMSRAGDSTAADALQRVTGLTIEDGQYVVIRGAPARYTQTLWNGSPLPSPDPIRRIVPLDLFPTGALSGIGVAKSYDAAQPGSFGAGLVELETAGMPDEDFFEVSVSTGGNTVSTGEDGLTYSGGGRDHLGEDDGTRAINGRLQSGFGRESSTSDELTEGARRQPNRWAVERETLAPDTGIGINGGGRYSVFGGELGVRGGFNWGRKYRRTEQINRSYALRGDGGLALRDDKVEERTDMNVDIGGLLGARLDWDRHALGGNAFWVRKTRDRAQITEGFDATSDDRFAREYLLEWNERELFARQLTGEHDFDFVAVDWRAMVAESTREAPDRREYIYLRQPDGEFVFFRQNGAERRWNESEDDVDSFDLDLVFPVLGGNGVDFDVASGWSTYGQERESQTRRLDFDVESGADLSESPEELLGPDNIGDTVTVSDQTQTNDNYIGEADIDALYLKGDVDWYDTVRVVAGLRREDADFRVRTFVAGGSAGGQQVAGRFSNSDLLPSLALTWRFHDDMQLRGSYGRTLSRPVLNELSPARYFDPDSGQEYRGNPDLEPAEIDSFDLRWEWYPGARESVSAGWFTKDYTNPIEETFTGVGGSDPIRTVQNAEGATVSGVELAGRTDFTRLLAPLGRTGDWSDRVYLQANAAFIDSEVELARQDLATSGDRPLQGQADEVYNLQLGHDGERHDWTLSLNHVGERLRIAGRQGQPDVFQQPVSLLDAKYSYQWTEAAALELSAGNLLDETVELRQGGLVYESHQPGIDVGVAFKYRF